MYGMLVPVGGGDPIPLQKEEILVGRKDDCDIVLRFGNVSSKHCRLVLSNGYWYVLDMNSKNGVKVNGVKVTDHRVDPGAILAISKHLFKLQYDPAANGAIGQPLNNVLYEVNIFSRSLMERAGLQHAAPKTKKSGHAVSDIPAAAPKNQKSGNTALSPTPPNIKKDYFSRLKFD
jgi:adenylate cyclase